MTEPARERVEAYEQRFGCWVSVARDYCGTHRTGSEVNGCPVAVTAAQVEAEELAALRAVVEQVRALADDLDREGYPVAHLIRALLPEEGPTS